MDLSASVLVPGKTITVQNTEQVQNFWGETSKAWSIFLINCLMLFVCVFLSAGLVVLLCSANVLLANVIFLESNRWRQYLTCFGLQTSNRHCLWCVHPWKCELNALLGVLYYECVCRVRCCSLYYSMMCTHYASYCFCTFWLLPCTLSLLVEGGF